MITATTDTVGLTIREERVDGVVLRRSLGRSRVLGAFTVPLDEEAPAALRARLAELKVRPRRVHVGLPRRLAVVKVIDLPAVPGANLRRMVTFELERHLPFAPADALFDFEVIDSAPGRPVRVLLVAVDRRAYERVRQLCRELGGAPRVVDVAIHALLGLGTRPRRGTAPGVQAVLYIGDSEGELAVGRDGRLLLSRAFALPRAPEARPAALGAEVVKTLAGLRVEDRAALAELAVVGGDPALLPEGTEVPVQFGLDTAAVDGSALEPEQLPALAMALREPLRGPLHTNLVPMESRPRPFPWPLAVTAGLAAAALGLAVAVPAVTFVRDERHLTGLDHRGARMATDVKRVERLALEVERARRELETLRGFEGQNVRALPVLRELTELLPADVWLTSVSAEAKGIELAGFAAAAAPLIPLIEASPTFERVEFTSPVTKGRDREQFRLKAAWEIAAAASPAAPPAPGAGAGRAGPAASPRPGGSRP